MQAFYERVIGELVGDGRLSPSARVLVVCGGDVDRDVLEKAGFANVTITNLDPGTRGEAYAPFHASVQDAESLSYGAGEFDVAVVHAGLHHCRSPHRALLEMYRVAKRSVLVIEARDSFAMRQATRLGVAADYEVSAVQAHNWTHGGVANSPIPNYVYRWTEREVEKTLASCNPEGRQKVDYFYGLDLPFDYVESKRLLRALAIPLQILTWALPSQGNCFGFWVTKPTYPDDLQPWLTVHGDAVVPKTRSK
jgi:SAM-dependent methyltransferase